MKLFYFMILYIIFGLCLFAGIENHFKLPVVYWSQSQDRCVGAESAGQLVDCENLPIKYQLMVVK